MTSETTTNHVLPIAFVDCETLGLDPDKHPMWELAVIRRENGVDTEHLWQIRPSRWELEEAEPKALEINGYRERMVLPDDYQVGDMTHACGLPHPMKRHELRDKLRELLDGAVMVGSNPAFDAAFLRVFLDAAPWHYRTVDIATLAAGYRHGQAASGSPVDYPRLPYKSYELSRQVGVQPPDEEVAHTALGDARWARDVFDTITGGGR